MSNEEKAKLDNIAHLQNICEKTKHEGHLPKPISIDNNNNNDNNTNSAICSGMNIRRERTRREKIEMEMKKWSKKVENQKSAIINSNNANSHIVIDDINTCQNNATINSGDANDTGYDVVKLDEYKKNTHVKGDNSATALKHNANEDDVSNTNNNITNSANSSSNNATQTFICYICQRKFPSEEKLKLHESMSELHKANLEKQRKETLS